MKRILATILLALTLPFAAHADEATHRAKAQQMVTLLHLDRLITQMIDGITTQANTVTKRMAGETPSADQQGKLNTVQKKIHTAIDDQMGWKANEAVYVDLYAKTFTDEELDGMIAFYKSPAGVSMVDKLPGLNAQAQQVMGQKMAALQPQVQQIMQDFQKEIAPAPPTLTPKQP